MWKYQYFNGIIMIMNGNVYKIQSIFYLIHVRDKMRQCAGTYYCIHVRIDFEEEGINYV